MNGKHEETLAAVFRNPVSGTTEWTAIEALFIALSAEVIEVPVRVSGFARGQKLRSFIDRIRLRKRSVTRSKLRETFWAE